MKALCPKCGKITEFKQKDLIVRAGDCGFATEDSWYCTECMFAPFLKPEEIKG